jgi:membrane associated rhomboid family serine protease
MVSASVGFQCPECVQEGNRGVRQARTVFGGRVSSDPGWVSKVLIAVNAVAFVVQQVSDRFTVAFFDIGRAVDPATLEEIGVAAGEPYRLLTSAFLHGGIFHLLLNMYVLYLFGPPLEAAFGRTRFLAVYLVSALGGGAASFAFSAPNQPSLGASGAIFGLLGAFLVVNRRLGRDSTGLLVLLALNLGLSFVVPRIDWRAHLGGLAVGLLCAAVLAYAPRRHRNRLQAAGLVVVLLLVLAVVAARVTALT